MKPELENIAQEASSPAPLPPQESEKYDDPPTTGWLKGLKEWTYHIVTSVLLVALIKWLTFDIYVIPTPSMEGALLVGDFLLVSKLSYGARTPQTLIQLPLTNGTIWGTNIPAYLNWIQLPMYRLPGLGKVERGEMVVFHYPAETEKPPDVRTFYVKRCVALPGDSLYMRAGKLFVNGTPFPELPTKQQRYLLRTSRTLRPHVFERLGIWEVNQVIEGYVFHGSEKQAQQLTEIPFVTELQPLLAPANYHDKQIFPQSPHISHNTDYFSPLRLPHKGMSIVLNDTSLTLYGSTIVHHEELSNVTIRQGTLYLGDQPQTTYTFNKDYYFMMGDNRHNSQDSRYWGFVPEDHVVGKPILCLMSFNRYAKFWHTFRWSRFFKFLE